MKIRKKGLTKNFVQDWYHYLLRVGWWQYLLVFVLAYLSINSFFAFLYFIGGDSIINAQPSSYWESWVFSFQTSTTLGYGHLLPKSLYAHIIVVFDLLSGILFVAVFTGMAFAKLSRPISRVLFSDKIILTTYNGRPYLKLRLGNTRYSNIVDAQVSVVVVIPEVSAEGHEMRRLYDLKLERDKSPLFGLSWTVMHEIDLSSPLSCYDLDEIKSKRFIFIVSFTGIDEVYSQTVHGQKTYGHDDIMRAKKFVDILKEDDKGIRYIDYEKFHDIVETS